MQKMKKCERSWRRKEDNEDEVDDDVDEEKK